MPHKHPVYDTDTHFSINPVTRVLKNEASSKTSLIQYDHNCERFTFEIPKTIEGHDMSKCNVVQVHYINIDSQTKKSNYGVYDIDDMQISPDNADVLVLSWLISGNATKLVGPLNFIVRFSCVENGDVLYTFNTAIYSGVSISSGIYNGEIVAEEYTDILAQFEERIAALESVGGGSTGGTIVKTEWKTAEINNVNYRLISKSNAISVPPGTIYANNSDNTYVCDPYPLNRAKKVRVSGNATSGYGKFSFLGADGNSILCSWSESTATGANGNFENVEADVPEGAVSIIVSGSAMRIMPKLEVLVETVVDVPGTGGGTVVVEQQKFDWTKYEGVPYYGNYRLPALILNGDVSAMTKKNAVQLNYEVRNWLSKDESVNQEGTLTMKWQGNTSLKFPKKNYTAVFDKPFNPRQFNGSGFWYSPGWGEQTKYCLKANWVDSSYCRNLVCAMLFGQMVKTRKNTLPQLLTAPNCGAVDGFPFMLIVNGEYQGVYTWNIPKDPWMFGMGSGNHEMLLCADANSSYPELVAACQFKGPAVLVENENGSTDFAVEYISDENDTEWAKTLVNNLISRVRAAVADPNAQLDSLSDILDIESAIDTMLFTGFNGGQDNVKKNYLMVSYDGVKIAFSVYDMDGTLGNFWHGERLVKTNAYPMIADLVKDHELFRLLWDKGKDRVLSRWTELRKTILTIDNISYTVDNFLACIPDAVKRQESVVWPKIPNSYIGDAPAIIDWVRDRLSLLDKEIGYAPDGTVTKVSQLENDRGYVDGETVKQQIDAAVGSLGGSGGGCDNSELIADITTTEEVNMITINRDLNGNPFNVIGWTIIADIPPASSTHNFFIRTGTYGGGAQFTNMLTTAQKRGYIFAVTANISKDMIAEVPSYFCTNAPVISQTSLASNANHFQTYTNASDVMFPVGTRVRIWGIKIS